MVLVSKNERLLLDFLKEGSKQYSEIMEHLGKKGIKKRTANNLLKECCGSGKIFRIKRKDGKTFYRLNDFPKEVQLFFAFIDSYQQNDTFKRLLKQLKDDVIRFCPDKLTFDQILDFWYASVRALREGDPSAIQVFEKFKEALE